MLGLANVLLATVEAVYDANALAVEGGVCGVHGMAVMRSDIVTIGHMKHLGLLHMLSCRGR